MRNLLNKKLFVSNSADEAESYIVFSSFKDFNHSFTSNHFAIKYVKNGCEKYMINGQRYDVCGGQYLLNNYVYEGNVEINSREDVVGICINIATDIIPEVVSCYRRPDTPFSDIALGKFFGAYNLLENKYKSAETILGKTLIQLGMLTERNLFGDFEFDSGFYYTIAEAIVADHIPIYKQLQLIRAVKHNTRKDLLKRVLRAKEYMDAYFKLSPDIRAVASEANISEYHFFRLFKSIYGLTPHQYIIRKKLEYSLAILKQSNFSISNAAFESGFSDIYTFSKSFKKYFRVSPSSILHNCKNLNGIKALV